MLVGESRAEEQPPLTLEWAGYPHPSPRPRHRHRQMSLEEPLSGFSGRRYVSTQSLVLVLKLVSKTLNIKFIENDVNCSTVDAFSMFKL